MEKRLRNRALEGNAEEVRMLIGKGAGINSMNEDGYAAAHCAAARGRLGVLRLLKQLGADMRAVSLDGKTALEVAAEHGHHHLTSDKILWPRLRPDMLSAVSARDIQVAPRPGRVHWNDVAQKRLRLCAAHGDLDGVRALLDAGVDVLAEDENGHTAAQLAESRGYSAIVNALEEAEWFNIKMNRRKHNLNPMETGLGKEPPEQRRLLLARAGHAPGRGRGLWSRHNDEDSEGSEVEVRLRSGRRRPRTAPVKATSDDDEDSHSTHASRARTPLELQVQKVFHKLANAERLERSKVPAALELLSMPKEHAAAVFKMLDEISMSKAKTISLPELTRVVKALRRRSSARPASPASTVGGRNGALSAAKKEETVGDVFRRFDKDNSGTLDVAELRAALADLKLPLGSPAISHILANLEANPGSALTLPDFRTLVKSLKAAATAPPSAVKKEETVGDVFRRFDKDNGGTLDVAELRAALTDLKISLHSPEAAHTLGSLEANPGSALTLPEFRTLVKSLRAQHPQLAASPEGDDGAGVFSPGRASAGAQLDGYSADAEFATGAG